MKSYFIVGLILSIIFLIIGICYLINSIHQYGTWKAPTVICILFTALGIFCSAGIFRCSQKKPSTSSIQTATTGKINEPNAVQQLNTDNKQSQEEQNVLKSLQKSYQSLGTVSFDTVSKTYHIRVTDQNTINGLNYVLQHPDQANQVGYNKLTNTLKKTSISICKVLGNQYRIALMNPQNNQQAMYVVQNGETETNVINQ